MKRIIAILLCSTICLTACSNTTQSAEIASTPKTEMLEYNGNKVIEKCHNDNKSSVVVSTSEDKELDVEISGLDDKDLLYYTEDRVYSELVNELDSEEYFVENVDAIYYPKEYIEELDFNSQDNIYFGYSSAELEKEFQGMKYVFTLDTDGQTTVIPMENIDDNTYAATLKNVAIGSGVILICVSVSIVSAGVGAPAISMLFATSAIRGTTFAVSSACISGIAAAIIKGYETEDFKQAMKAGVEAGADGFKWGAIIGATSGGINQAKALRGATLNGLTMNEAAAMQQASKWPLDAIKNIHSTAEYEIYKKAGLKPVQLSNGEWAFIRKINWDLVDEFGRTNVQRVLKYGLAPIDSTGMPYELHHIGMNANSPLAILTNAEHHAKENFKILHYKEQGKNVTDAVWKEQKKEFWNVIVEMAERVK